MTCGSNPGRSETLFLKQSRVSRHRVEAKMVCVVYQGSLCSYMLVAIAVSSEAVAAVYQAVPHNYQNTTISWSEANRTRRKGIEDKEEC